jgi:hypothetical protein
MQPPPPCTSSNEAPIADSVLAAASVGAIVGGGIVANNTKDCGGFPCGAVNGLTGDGMIILGGIGTLLFVSSAITGYGRTAACRDWLEGGGKSVSATPSRISWPAGSWLVVPPSGCSNQGDAPLICASRPRLTAEASDGK